MRVDREALPSKTKQQHTARCFWADALEGEEFPHDVVGWEVGVVEMVEGVCAVAGVDLG